MGSIVVPQDWKREREREVGNGNNSFDFILLSRAKERTALNESMEFFDEENFKIKEWCYLMIYLRNGPGILSRLRVLSELSVSRDDD